MELFDTHAHLLDDRFDEDRETLIASMTENGLTGLIEIGTDMENSRAAAKLAARANNIYAAVGVHPHEAQDAAADYLDELEALTKQKKVVAIGEIGLDYHYDFSPRDVQKTVFDAQLSLARSLDMPVVIHMREATADTMDILRAYKGVRGVLHCFSGSAETAREVIDLGMYVSFTGTVTFKNARKTVDAAAAVPLERLMAETDCPYLSPEPKRGKRNDPTNVQYVIAKLAEIKGISFDAMCETNIANAKELFTI